jgi:hypothetical protein
LSASPLHGANQDSDEENVVPNHQTSVIEMMRKKTKEANETRVQNLMMRGQATVTEVKTTFGDSAAKEYEIMLKAHKKCEETLTVASASSPPPPKSAANTSIPTILTNASTSAIASLSLETTIHEKQFVSQQESSHASLIQQLRNASEQSAQQAREHEESLLQKEMLEGRASISAVVSTFGSVVGDEYVQFLDKRVTKRQNYDDGSRGERREARKQLRREERQLSNEEWAAREMSRSPSIDRRTGVQNPDSRDRNNCGTDRTYCNVNHSVGTLQRNQYDHHNQNCRQTIHERGDQNIWRANQPSSLQHAQALAFMAHNETMQQIGRFSFQSSR